MALQKQEPVLSVPDAPIPEYRSMLDFTQQLDAILQEDKYIARSDYRHLIEDFAEIYTFFSNLKIAKATGYYCQVNNIDEASIEVFLRQYADLSDLREGSLSIQQHNQTFLKNHLASERII